MARREQKPGKRAAQAAGKRGSTAKGGRHREENQLKPSGATLGVKFAAVIAFIIFWIMIGFGLITFRKMQESHIEIMERQGYLVVTNLASIGQEFLQIHGIDRYDLVGSSEEQKRVYARLNGYMRDALFFHGSDSAKPSWPAEALNAEIVLPQQTGGTTSTPRRPQVAAGQDRIGKYQLSIIKGSRKALTIREGDKELETDVVVTRGSVKPYLTGTEIPVRRFEKPIYSSEGGPPLGTAVLTLSEERIEKALRHLRQFFLVATLLAVCIGISASVVLASFVTRPIWYLIRDMDVVGKGDLDHPIRARSSDEIGVLAKAFGEMTKELKVAHQAEIANRALEYELTIARDIQKTLLPKAIPQLRGFDMEGFYRPAKEVGGDYYDFIDIDDNRLGIVVADVSGKGIPGSMVMTQVRSIIRLAAVNSQSCHETLVKTNAIIAREIRQGMFVTVIYAILDKEKRVLSVCSAGHNPLVLCRKAADSAGPDVQLVNPRGIALGFDKGQIFSATLAEEVIELKPGDRIVIYTDGVVEAMNEKNEEFGDERFRDLVKTSGDCSSRDFVETLIKELDAHRGVAPPHDDITIVTFRLEPETVASEPPAQDGTGAAVEKEQPDGVVVSSRD